MCTETCVGVYSIEYTMKLDAYSHPYNNVRVVHRVRDSHGNCLSVEQIVSLKFIVYILPGISSNSFSATFVFPHYDFPIVFPWNPGFSPFSKNNQEERETERDKERAIGGISFEKIEYEMRLRLRPRCTIEKYIFQDKVNRTRVKWFYLYPPPPPKF